MSKGNAVSVLGPIKGIKRTIKYLEEEGLESAQMTKLF